MSIYYQKNGKRKVKKFGQSLTRQSEMRNADINLIMAKYEKTGVLPPATREGFFADVSQVGDYRDALNRVERADKYFLHLPAAIRKKFDNDPAAFLDYVSDKDNLAEIEEMGLIAKSDKDVPVDPAGGRSKVDLQSAGDVAGGDGGDAQGSVSSGSDNSGSVVAE